MVRRSRRADKGAKVAGTGTTNGRSRPGKGAILDAGAERPRTGDDRLQGDIPLEQDLAGPLSSWAPSPQGSASGGALLPPPQTPSRGQHPSYERLTWRPTQPTAQHIVDNPGQGLEEGVQRRNNGGAEPQTPAGTPQTRTQEATEVAPTSWQHTMEQIVRECGCALSAQFRKASRAKRSQVLRAVQNAVDRATSAVVAVRQEDEEASEIVQALGTTAERLGAVLPRILQESAYMRALANALGCDVSEVGDLLRSREEEIAALRSQLATFQVEQQLVPQLVQSAQPLRAESALSKAVPPYTRLCRSMGGFAQKTDGPPSTSYETSSNGSTIRSSHSRPTDGFSPSPSSLERCRPASVAGSNTQNELLLTLTEVLKSQSVSEVRKYDGKRSLTDFLREIDVKYPRWVWSDADRRDILLNHLEGTAKAHAHNLPVEILNGTFDGLVEELRKARHTPCERLKAQADWKNLRKHEKESVFDFCCRLQKIAKRMSPKTDCDFEMGSKLYECLSDWKDSYYMLAALDSADGHVFDEVRKVALRLERTREATSSAPRRTWEPRPDNSSGDGKGCPHQGKALPKAIGDYPKDQRWCQRQPRDAFPRNHQLGSPKSSKWPASKTSPNTDGSSKAQDWSRCSFSTHLESWCRKVKRVPAPKLTAAHGGSFHCDIRVFGLEAEALIDSGSVITILPLGLLKKARDQGADLDKMVTMMGDGGDSQVQDASGNPMSFLMRIATAIQVKGGGSARVQMHIQKSDSDTILIGTNAFEALRIQIRLGSRAIKARCSAANALSHGLTQLTGTVLPTHAECAGKHRSTMGRQSSRRRKRTASRASHMRDRARRAASPGKRKADHLKFASDRLRPQKVSEAVSNPAPASRVRMSGKSVRVSRDRSAKHPPEISDTPVTGKRIEDEGSVIDGDVVLAALITLRWTPASWTVGAI
ncbi:hypothetical protein Y032_0013g1920 [Ancylostoma ceylanicum]|uniref:Peptidase A2 domain-containing protein n=1 Tax=Ancylostoma ceylanicum TaxID=53326 RepID=A0A016VBQ6_9BILA|nr:hypothetical protein Y032_0013g1920 [Ancylostoma ceylanicum]